MKNLLFLIIAMFITTSCGDLFMKTIEDADVNFSQFATCEMDSEAFSHILDEDISIDILCLKENLHLFMDTVKTDRPGYASKTTLKDYIVNGPSGIDPKTADIVDSVFDLSHLIIGTDREYIIRSDVDVLLDFLIYFNKHIWKPYKYFKSTDDVNYYRHLKERQIIFDELALISNKLASIYNPDRTNNDRIDIEHFLFNFFKDEHSTLEKIRSAMFLKRVFLGGEVWDLTHTEFSKALNSIPYLAQVAFDIAKVENYEFADEQKTLISVFLNDIDIIKKLIFFDATSHQAVFSIYDAINAFITLAPDALSIDLEKYTREIMKIKEIFLGNGGELVSSRELMTAFEHGENILEEALLFYRVYESDLYSEDLNNSAPITHDFKDYPVNNSRDEKFLEHFADIAKSYKFFKGSETSAFYTFDYNRNANAFFQTGALEYGVKLIMNYYGKANPNARGVYKYDMTLDETVTFIDDFKWFLKDQGILSIGRKGGGEVQGVADNLVLMSTLFQYQSNGCDSEYVCMEVPETVEFITGLLTAISIKDFFTDTMSELCSEHLDEYGRIAPACFRQNFINVIETEIPNDGRAIADYMPNLYEYLLKLVKDVPVGEPITESKDFMKFITETEAFTRSCMYYDDEKTDEVYLRVNDAFAVFAGLLNVESTLLRFDIDKNNKIDGRNSNGTNEVLKAYYATYRGAITSMVIDTVGGNEWIGRKLAKPIFQYLVKYGEVPDTAQFSSIWRFARFIFRRNKNADITRTTVATMLKTISEQSETSAEHKYKCEECFRDPTTECLPEGDPWD